MNFPPPLLVQHSAPDVGKQPLFAQLSQEQRKAIVLEQAWQNVLSFAAIFDSLAAEKLLPVKFAVLSQVYLSDQVACENAIQIAQAHSFIDVLAERLAVAPGPAVARAAEALGSLQVRAIAEAVTNASRGFIDTAVIMELCQVANALCMVKDGATSLGTGMLLEDDLILTAAHVLDQCGYRPDGSTNATVRHNVSFSFNSPQFDAPFRARLAEDWLVARSPACIETDAGRDLSEHLAANLDYALLRIEGAAPMHIRRLGLRSTGRLPREPLSADEKQRRYYVMGYP